MPKIGARLLPKEKFFLRAPVERCHGISRNLAKLSDPKRIRHRADGGEEGRETIFERQKMFAKNFAQSAVLAGLRLKNRGDSSLE